MRVLTASDVLRLYWPEGHLPIRPDEIAKRAKIIVEESNDPNHSGSYKRVGRDGRPVITYSSNESFVRQRFTLAHELGHHFLKHGSSFRDTFEGPSSYSPKEISANHFAADLLMPANTVRSLFIAPQATLSRLAESFGVSEIAMEYRLKNLGLIS